MKTSVKFKKGGLVELSHAGSVELFHSVSKARARAEELNIDILLVNVTAEQ